MKKQFVQKMWYCSSKDTSVLFGNKTDRKNWFKIRWKTCFY